MPLVRIDLREGTTPEYRQAIADAVYKALVSAAGAPVNDKFVIVTEHPPENLVMDKTYLVERSDQALIIQITFNSGRTLDTKKALYEAVANGLNTDIGIRLEDVFISLVEVPKENWSFGLGVAQYAE